jgi:hypothetical protein
MYMPLPTHVRGWSIPATETEPGLTVVRATSAFGWHFEVGDLDEAMTKIDPKQANAWVVESERRPGITFMEFKASGSWNSAYRAAGALLHFCVEVNELGAEQTMTVDRITVKQSDPQSVMILENLGFSAFYEGADMLARPDRVHQFTAQRFPEFVQAVPIPQLAE